MNSEFIIIFRVHKFSCGVRSLHMHAQTNTHAHTYCDIHTCHDDIHIISTYCHTHAYTSKCTHCRSQRWCRWCAEAKSLRRSKHTVPCGMQAWAEGLRRKRIDTCAWTPNNEIHFSLCPKWGTWGKWAKTNSEPLLWVQCIYIYKYITVKQAPSIKHKYERTMTAHQPPVAQPQPSMNERLQKELLPTTGEIHKPSQEEVWYVLIVDPDITDMYWYVRFTSQAKKKSHMRFMKSL